jgi:cyclopropane fatty-acyl-phospholipid synthase-like methyltransferase
MNARCRLGSAAIAVLSLAAVLTAQQRDPETYAKTLEGAERVARMQVPRVLETLGLTAGAKVAEIVERTSTEAGLANVKTVLAATDDPKLPEPVDLAFICDALHHIGNQGTYLKTLAKSVKPGGRVAVIDFSEKWPQGHEAMRFSVADLDGWMKGAGFTRSASHTYLENSFFVIYRR